MGHPEHVLTAPEITGDPRDYAVDFNEVNARDNYSLHMVFKRTHLVGNKPEKRAEIAAKLQAAVSDVVVRGVYDVSGFRADADLMVWALADNAEALQDAYRRMLAVGCCHGPLLEPVWSAMSRHLPAEFSPAHLPACWGGFAPRKYMTVYPFVRSWDWYYLPKQRRAAILREHGQNGADFNDVAVSTLAAFALGDWEWTVTLESDRLVRVMEVLRKQREAEARLFVRIDTPFYTGVATDFAAWLESQPRRAPKPEHAQGAPEGEHRGGHCGCHGHHGA